MNTAKPARTDRRNTSCINCTERLVRETKDANGRHSFHHASNGLERCPDHAQPRDTGTVYVDGINPWSGLPEGQPHS